MAKDMRKCPYCGEIIEIGVSKCKYCGESVGAASPDCVGACKKAIKNVKLPSNKVIGMIVTSLLIIGLAFGGVFYFYSKENQTAKDVFGAMTSLETPEDVLESVELDEKLLKRYLKQSHFQSNKDKVFAQFVKRLEKRSNNFDEKLELWNSINESGYGYDAQERRVISANGIDFRIDDSDEITITSHYCPFFKLLSDGEGGFYASTSWTYLSKTYSKYLSEPYKAELNELTLEEKEEGSLGYYADGGITITKQQVLDRALFWIAFREKYPDFHTKDVNVRINLYVSDLMSDAYNTWDYGSGYDTSKLKSTAQKAYEEFLNKVDKNTYEYKVVKECYDILKKNGYYANEEFYSKVRKFSESGPHN